MSTPDHQGQQRAARDLLAHEIRAAIARATAATPTVAGAGPADSLAGVRAARLARDVAAGQLREQALQARGAGHYWDDIAIALELTDTSDDSENEGCGQRLGELAWEWLIEHRPPPPDGRHGMAGSAVWVCTACRARVRDTGPYAAHPDDRETGHAPGCPRHQAALAAYRDELTHHNDDHHDHQDHHDHDYADEVGDAALAPLIEDTTGHQKGDA